MPIMQNDVYQSLKTSPEVNCSFLMHHTDRFELSKTCTLEHFKFGETRIRTRGLCLRQEDDHYFGQENREEF